MLDKLSNIYRSAEQAAQSGQRGSNGTKRLFASQKICGLHVHPVSKFIRIFRSISCAVNSQISNPAKNFKDAILGAMTQLQKVIVFTCGAENDAWQIGVPNLQMGNDCPRKGNTVFHFIGIPNSVAIAAMWDQQVECIAYMLIEAVTCFQNPIQSFPAVAVIDKCPDQSASSFKVSNFFLCINKVQSETPILSSEPIQSNSQYKPRMISGAGVASNFGASQGTGVGRSAQDSPNITFSEREAS